MNSYLIFAGNGKEETKFGDTDLDAHKNICVRESQSRRPVCVGNDVCLDLHETVVVATTSVGTNTVLNPVDDVGAFRLTQIDLSHASGSVRITGCRKIFKNTTRFPKTVSPAKRRVEYVRKICGFKLLGFQMSAPPGDALHLRFGWIDKFGNSAADDKLHGEDPHTCPQRTLVLFESNNFGKIRHNSMETIVSFHSRTFTKCTRFALVTMKITAVAAFQWHAT